VSDKQQQNEVARLTGLLCDGQISEAEMGQLDRLLAGDPAARSVYREYLTLDVALAWAMLGSAREADADRIQPHAPVVAASVGPSRSPVLGFLRASLRSTESLTARYSIAIAIVVLLASGAWVGTHSWGLRTVAGPPQIASRGGASLPSPSGKTIAGRPAPLAAPTVPTGDSAPVARLTRAVDVRRAIGTEPVNVGGQLATGQKVQIESGLAEVIFPKGVNLVLQGPASLTIESERSVFLAGGRLTARLTSAAARGFTVRTPKSIAIDEGTEFGIDVQPGGDENIHVFQGKVRFAVNSKGGPRVAQRELTANQGARLNAETDGVELLADTGEAFTRSLKNSDKDGHTVAYWRFEDGAVGTLAPNNNQEQRDVRATADCSGNGNDLFIWDLVRASRFSADVPAATVVQTGRANRGSLDNSVAANLRQGIPNLYTNSRFSHASPIDVEKIVPAQWTIEASVKPVRLGDQPQIFLGRDGGTFVGAQKRQLAARLAFSINAAGRFAVSFIDAKRRDWEAVAEQLQVKEKHWYHVAAVSDGRALRLYVDALDGQGYQLRATTALATAGGTALGVGTATAHWTIGRGRDSDGRMARWYQGLIDEVRISDIARSPDEFLFAKQGNSSQKVFQ
jgi:hypothetical protein